MSFSIRHEPNRPIFDSRPERERERENRHAVMHAANMTARRRRASSASHRQPGDDVYTDREVNVCSGQMVTSVEKKITDANEGRRWMLNNVGGYKDGAPSPTTFTTPQKSPL